MRFRLSARGFWVAATLAILTLALLAAAELLLQTSAGAWDPLAPPAVTAKSVYVFDATADATLYALNADERRPPASTTKLATAIVVMEQVTDFDETITVDATDVLNPEQGQSMVGFVEGDVLTVDQMMYGLLLNSGNDAAHALARHIGGKLLAADGAQGDPIDRFVQEMNGVVDRLGLKNTHFVNPTGLYDPDHYTSAHDLAIIAREAFSYPRVSEISGVSEMEITSVGPAPRSFLLQNTNQMLGEYGVKGGKTGTLSESEACLVVSKTGPADNSVIGVVLGSEIQFDENDIQIPESDRRYDDMRTLLASLDVDYRWIAPLQDGALPGLKEELNVWDVELRDTQAVVLPADQAAGIRYLLQLGPPAEPEAEVGSLLIYSGDQVVDREPVFQEATR
jgi:D-alanyl-D-alanine carboxypeptidase